MTAVPCVCWGYTRRLLLSKRTTNGTVVGACTGFFVTFSHVLTAGHCITGTDETGGQIDLVEDNPGWMCCDPQPNFTCPVEALWGLGRPAVPPEWLASNSSKHMATHSRS
jgi:hypothetical protein